MRKRKFIQILIIKQPTNQPKKKKERNITKTFEQTCKYTPYTFPFFYFISFV